VGGWHVGEQFKVHLPDTASQKKMVNEIAPQDVLAVSEVESLHANMPLEMLEVRIGFREAHSEIGPPWHQLEG
jgi:hypothetical protein